MEPIRILLVEDNEDDALLVVRQFRKAGYLVDFKRVDTAPALAEALKDGEWDAIISDVSMPNFSARAALEMVRNIACDCPFLVVSGVIGEENAVSLLKNGADDFVLKSNLARLLPAFERERREADRRRLHREAQEALHASEERYALASRGTNDGLWDWNLDNGRVFFSPRWREMLGVDALGDHLDDWFSLIHPDDRAATRAALDDHLKGSLPLFTIEHRLRHSNGTWRWMLARGVGVFDANKNCRRMAGSLTDVTASRQALQDLHRANQDLEQAMAAKSRFLAAASHDLRQPVQALFCFTSVMRASLAGNQVQTMVEEVEGSLQSLKALLDALLDVSKLDAGVIVPSISAFPVTDVLERIRVELGPVAEAKGLTLKVVPSKMWVTSDPILLGQIVRNLAENAVRYTNRGKVLVGCRRQGPDAFSIEVWDNGVGIPLECQEQIFEEFFQVGNPERDRRKGLGLGLAIVKRLSKLIDHPLSLRSAENRGSVFKVLVPTATATEQSTSAERLITVGQGGGGPILVIDDETLVANALARVLTQWGMEPMVAESEDEAMGHVRVLAGQARMPLAIVADYRLRNGRTGAEAIESIQRYCGRRIPSVVITGDTGIDRLRDFSSTETMVLHKPVMPADLLSALQSIMTAAL